MCFVIKLSLLECWLTGQAFFSGVRSGEDSSFSSSRVPGSIRGGRGVSRGYRGNTQGSRHVDAFPNLGTYFKSKLMNCLLFSMSNINFTSISYCNEYI
jgi:hypothetical protein